MTTLLPFLSIPAPWQTPTLSLLWTSPVFLHSSLCFPAVRWLTEVLRNLVNSEAAAPISASTFPRELNNDNNKNNNHNNKELQLVPNPCQQRPNCYKQPPIRIQFVLSLSNSWGIGNQNREQREKQSANCFPGNLDPLGKIERTGEFIMKHLSDDFYQLLCKISQYKNPRKIEAPITGIWWSKILKYSHISFICPWCDGSFLIYQIFSCWLTNSYLISGWKYWLLTTSNQTLCFCKCCGRTLKYDGDR